MGHSIGSDLEKDLTQPTCRSWLIQQPLDGSSVTFFSARPSIHTGTPAEKKVIRGGAVLPIA